MEALLAHAQSADRFLAAPIGALAASVLGDEPEAPLVGRHVGAYQIVSLLAQGQIMANPNHLLQPASSMPDRDKTAGTPESRGQGRSPRQTKRGRGPDYSSVLA